jgi:hypothetical protein
MMAGALVIPAWNEPESIGRVLAEVPPGVVDHVFVVVGSAADPTAEVARAGGAQVLIPNRRGYGAACATGARAALAVGADVVAFLDGDYSDPPADLPRLLAPIAANQADLVLGCRTASFGVSPGPNRMPPSMASRIGVPVPDLPATVATGRAASLAPSDAASLASSEAGSLEPSATAQAALPDPSAPTASTRGLAALPLHARLGNRLVLLGIRLLVGRGFADLPSFKVVRADALRRLDMREMTYGWTVEMLVKATRAELRIAERPVAYRARLGGQSKVSGTLGGSLGAAWKLCRCTLGYAAWSPAEAADL